MKYIRLNNIFLSIIIISLLMVIGFIISDIINEPINDTSSKRIIEPIPEKVESDIITVNHNEDLNKQRKSAIAEAKRIEADRLDKYTEYEVALMAKVVHAEAGNQDDVGKRLVADVIMNRVDSLMFPNTVEEVVMQKNQFTIYDWYTIDDLNAVTDEIVDRTDKEIIFFRKDHYHNIGEPAYQYGDHYFSTIGD